MKRWSGGSMNTIELPPEVVLAEKFFWEVFLTSRWDVLVFKKANAVLLPNKVLIYPSKREWWVGKQIETDLVVVQFSQKNEDTADSVVKIGMRGEKISEYDSTYNWSPNSISLDIRIHNVYLQKEHGLRLKIGVTPVWGS